MDQPVPQPDELGEPVIVDGEVVGYQLPLPEPEEQPRERTRKRLKRKA
jgi:hypothetical protein